MNLVVFVLTQQKNYLDLVANIERMIISTIHSFAKEIIQNTSLPLGIGTDFTTVGGNYQREKILKKNLGSFLSKRFEKNPNLFFNIPVNVYNMEDMILDFITKIYEKGCDIKNADADFLRLLFSSKKINSFWQSKSNGTTNRQRVDFADFMKSTLPIPPLEEQKTILQKYQKTIKQAESFEKKADVLNFSIEHYLKETLGIPTINDDIKATLLTFGNFSDLSEKWIISPLQSEINEKLKLSKYKLQKVSVLNCITRSWKKNQQDKYFNYIEIGGINVETGKLNSEEIEVSKAPNRATQVVHTGDLIFGMTRPYLKKFAIIDKEHDNCICSSGFQVIEPSEEYNLNYILEIFKSNICISQFKEAMTGALYPALNAEQLKNIRIPLPPLSVQNEIVSYINQIKKQVKDLREQAKELREQARKEFEGSIFE